MWRSLAGNNSLKGHSLEGLKNKGSVIVDAIDEIFCYEQ